MKLRKMVVGSLLVVMLALSACGGSKFSGNYSYRDDFFAISFTGDNKATLSDHYGKNENAYTYEVDENEITFTDSDGDEIIGEYDEEFNTITIENFECVKQ